MLSLRVVQALAVSFVAIQPAYAQYKIGDRLIVISQAEVTSDGVVRQTLGRGQDIRVDDININLNQLRVKNLAAGWIRVDLVRTPEVAVGIFTDQIALNPLDVGAFYARGITQANLNQYDLAIADFTEAIRLAPLQACAFIGRGNCSANTANPAKAIIDYTEAIRLDPNSAIAFANRAKAWNASGEFTRAIADANEAIRLAPNYANAFSARAVAFAATKQFGEAFLDCDRIAAISPAGVSGYNDVAWLLAMSPDVAIRDGKKAIEFAMKASSLTNELDAGVLDTLAIASAEAADFKQAVAIEQKALAICSDRDRVDFEDHLKLFRASKTLLSARPVSGGLQIAVSKSKPVASSLRQPCLNGNCPFGVASK